MALIEKLNYSVPVAILGDIHGDADRLEQMLRLLGSRQVLVCGDLCDRGPDAKRVFDLLIARGARGVRGNHEEWMIALVNGRFDPFALHPVMGGEATLRSYGFEGRSPGAIESQRWRIPLAHQAFLLSLPIAVDLEMGGERYWLIHAGVPPTTRLAPGATLADVVPWLAAQKPDTLLWSHNEPESALPIDRPVIMGHVPQRAPVDLQHVIALDTGCGTCPPYQLSALLLPERRFLTV